MHDQRHCMNRLVKVEADSNQHVSHVCRDPQRILLLLGIVFGDNHLCSGFANQISRGLGVGTGGKAHFY